MAGEQWQFGASVRMDPSRLRIQLLGGLRLQLPNGGVIEELGPQSGALLARLALDIHRPVSREELIEFLWTDDHDLDEGRRRLRQLLFSIRQALNGAGFDGNLIFLSGRTTLQLNPAVVEVDSAVFVDQIRAARQAEDPRLRAERFESALSLYRGELLPGYFQETFLLARDRLGNLLYAALRDLARAHESLGQIDLAIQAATRAVSLNPGGEEAHCDLMRLYAVKGEPSAVLHQYREMERLLREELDVEPSPAARELLTELRSLEIRHEAPPAAPTPAPEPQRVSATTCTRAPEPKRSMSHRRSRLLAGARAAVILLVLLVAAIGIFRPHGRSRVRLPAVSGPGYLKAPLWVARYEGKAGDKDSEPEAIVTDSSGSSYIAGFIDTQDRDVDFLVFKLDRDGNRVGEEFRYNGPGNDVDRARCIARDSDGNVYVTGDSDNGTGDDSWTRLAGLDFCTIKLGPDLNPSPTWPDIGYGVGVRRYNSTDNGEDMPKKLLLDSSGGVYVMGYSYSRKGSRDWAVVKYDAATGRQVWEKRYDSPDHDEDQPNDMALSPDGELYVTGSSRLRPRDAPEFDILTIQYRQSDGKELWRSRWGAGNHADDFGKFIFVDQWHHFFVAGEGVTGPGTYNHTRSDYLTLLYDRTGRLHRARGAVSEADQLDRVHIAWPNGAVGVRHGIFYIVTRHEIGTLPHVVKYRNFS